MSHIYISGYYGYKNFGDELLLLGVIEFLISQDDLSLKQITIEAADYMFLTQYLLDYQRKIVSAKESLTGNKIRSGLYIETPKIRSTDSDTLSKITNNLTKSSPVSITCVPRSRFIGRKIRLEKFFGRSGPDYLVLGGGEGLTDSRPFPHNGRSALMRFLPFFLLRKVIAIGGFGSPATRLSKNLLYPLYMGRAHHIYARESSSCRVALHFAKKNKTSLYQDFSIDILDRFIQGRQSLKNGGELIGSKEPKTYGILNINAHIWSKESIERIRSYILKHDNINLRFFVPASCGGDDSDEMYGKLLQKELSHVHIVIWHWADVDLYETLSLIYGAKAAIVARLHLVLPLHLFDVPYEPLVYQPKITHMIAELDKR